MSSLWLRESEPFAEATPSLPASTDIAIIGGGVAGISTALHLARHGAAPLVLEAGAVSGRASGRNDGQLLLGLGEHYNRIVGQFGADRARLLWGFIRDNNQALRAAISELGIGCDLVQDGGLRLAETAHEWQELQQAAALLQQEGIAHELVPAAEVHDRFPAARGFFGALHLPGESIVQPVQMVRGLAHAATVAGAQIAELAAVATIRGRAGEFVVQLRDGRSVRAGVVVHCTSTLARELDSSGFLQKNVFPFRGQVLATGPLPAEILPQFPTQAMSSNFCYEYFRISRGRFVIGGMRWSVKGEELGVLDDDTSNPVVTDHLLGYVRRHFPSLADQQFPHVWTGIMAGTDDGLPLLGALPGQPGVFALLAFNGYGLSFAFAAGQCLAEMILDGKA
ncbi:MAG TPA: FAD-dependent oxidoreductase, partial [Planctomycetota bacterium]|nr:FAD-dependent oxidoreductase [Planctomycetota bacterium]